MALRGTASPLAHHHSQPKVLGSRQLVARWTVAHTENPTDKNGCGSDLGVFKKQLVKDRTKVLSSIALDSNKETSTFASTKATNSTPRHAGAHLSGHARLGFIVTKLFGELLEECRTLQDFKDKVGDLELPLGAKWITLEDVAKLRRPTQEREILL
jgi:hypothetical protein